MTRVVQFGRSVFVHCIYFSPSLIAQYYYFSEPLFDNVLTPAQLTAQVNNAKQNLTSLSINVTVSELAYGYQERSGAQDVLDAIDSINIHMLPFFDSNASTCKYLLYYAEGEVA